MAPITTTAFPPVFSIVRESIQVRSFSFFRRRQAGLGCSRGSGRDEFEEKTELLKKIHTVEPNKTNKQDKK